MNDLNLEMQYYALALVVHMIDDGSSFILSDFVESELNKNGYRGSIISNTHILSRSIDFLVENKFINVITDEYGPDIFEKGENYTDYYSEVSNIIPIAEKYSALGGSGEHWLRSAIMKINTKFENYDPEDMSSISLGQNEWEPLPIDREDSRYITAVQLATDALEAIEADNGFASNLPEERDAIVTSIKSGIETIKSGKPSKASLEASLIAPLKWVVKKQA